MARPKGSRNKKTLEREQQEEKEYNFDFMEGEQAEHGGRETRGKSRGNKPNAGTTTGSNGEGLKPSRNEDGASAGTVEGTTAGNEGSTNGVKTSILERIKSKREQGNSPVHHTKPSLFEGNNGTSETGTDDSDSGVKSDNRDNAGADSGLDERAGVIAGSDSSLDDYSTLDQSTDRGVKKPKGVVLDLPKPIGSKEGNKPVEKDKEKEPLTQKQANQYLPQMKDALKTFFKYADKGIEKTSKKTNIHIWTSIDDEEIEVLASTLVEGATRSPVLAGAVKGIATNHKRLQVGFILMPRFIETVKTYLPEFDTGGGLFGAFRQQP